MFVTLDQTSWNDKEKIKRIKWFNKEKSKNVGGGQYKM